MLGLNRNSGIEVLIDFDDWLALDYNSDRVIGIVFGSYFWEFIFYCVIIVEG